MRAVSSANSRLLEWLIVSCPEDAPALLAGSAKRKRRTRDTPTAIPTGPSVFPSRLQGPQAVGGFVSVEQREVQVQVDGLLQVRAGLHFLAERLRDHASVEELQRIVGSQLQGL